MALLGLFRYGIFYIIAGLLLLCVPVALLRLC
jgi:hypothetical protein